MSDLICNPAPSPASSSSRQPPYHPQGGLIGIYRSERFALMGYVVPGYVEDGAWMLWGYASVAVAVAVVVVLLARSFVRQFVGQGIVFSHVA